MKLIKKNERSSLQKWGSSKGAGVGFLQDRKKQKNGGNYTAAMTIMR